ncbi:hypothetical protein KY290_031705 [Solanum tuberosum]|uniref:RRM domain-containing protein n=1 Tax=Solanum tuberosum TaxID=4113 RepID=A0ABQ7U9Z9_SOLTU|nr:hypothetical protein KY284_030775 [Solanum tuberosum]KAH0654503.1 hypothetical protein KY289_032181 [Solanum tuberosum]KAH0743712.1 hypothetical protein KY290_031705 [Solanum tuberosum]
MKGILIELSRRVVRLPNNIVNGRLYCSPPSSSSLLPNNKLFSSSSLLPNNKLFVAGLSWSVDEKSLSDAFSSFGQVTEVRIMYDKETGRSRGFGFVYFSKDEEASSAKDSMDGKAFLGRPLRVSFALEKVRGAPVVVPRLTGTGNADRKTR